MATNNFEPMNFDMPLIVGGISDDQEDYTFEVESLIDDLKEENKELQFFNLEIKDGYYQGWQWQVEWADKYLDYDQITDPEQFSDYDADYYYGDTAENIREQVEVEKNKCLAYLEALKENGYTELYKVGQFSNGEAVYKEVK